MMEIRRIRFVVYYYFESINVSRTLNKTASLCLREWFYSPELISNE